MKYGSIMQGFLVKSAIYIMLLTALFSACNQKQDSSSQADQTVDQTSEEPVMEAAPEPASPPAKPDRFVQETVLLESESDYKHYSQVIVTRNDEVVVPVQDGFLYWANPEESLEPQFFEAAPVSVSAEKRVELIMTYYNVLSYYRGARETPLDTSLSFEELEEMFHESNEDYYPRYYRIPLVYHIDRSNGRYRFLYKTHPVALDLSAPPGQKTFEWTNDFRITLDSSNKDIYESDQTDLFIYEGYIGLSEKSIRDDVSPAFFNPKRGERAVFSREMFKLDGVPSYQPEPRSLSVTRLGNVVSVFSREDPDNYGRKIIGLALFSLSSLLQPQRVLSWQSTSKDSDRERVDYPGGLIPNDIYDGIAFHYTHIEGDPFHPLIQVGKNTVVTPYSDRDNLEWVEYDGTEFSDVNGPTVIAAGLPLAFNFSNDRRYLYLFRDSDNALTRYTVIFDEE